VQLLHNAENRIVLLNDFNIEPHRSRTFSPLRLLSCWPRRSWWSYAFFL